jgi:signal transduction histidine kinase
MANREFIAAVGDRQVIGKPIADALPELATQGLVAIVNAVYETGRPHVADSQAVTLNSGPQGAPRDAHFNFVCQPMRDHEGRVDGLAIVAVDVTEVVRARRHAEAENRAKDQFLAVLGHELRTPLSPILTAAQLLELKGPDSPSLRRHRETITRQAKHLAKLVEDLLDVGRIITGKLRLQKTRVDVATIVRNAVEACAPLISKRHHALAVTLPDTPLAIDADANRMVQVICNLLNNAAKYSSEGGRIDLCVAEHAGFVTIGVRDRGIGIPPEMLDRVFDRFVQAPVGDDTLTEGLGIGLSIVKSVVELHGGTVAAASDGPGTGSEFTIRVPAAAPVSAPAVAQ